MGRSFGCRHIGTLSKRTGEKGNTLVEVLVALLAASIFLAALGQDMSQLSVMAERAQQQFLAADLAQEVIDNVRNTTWADLDAIAASGGSSYQLAVNSNGGVTTPAVLPRDLLLDLSTFQYQSPKLADGITPVNEWNPTVNLAISALSGPQSDQITATVLVSWKTTNGQTKTYKTATTISQYGVHQ